MSAHAFYTPSGAHRWMNCPGSLAWPDNGGDEDSSVYADDGTASHNLGARALESGEDCTYFLGTKSTINGVDYMNDEERCEFVQVYVDKCRQLGIGGLTFVEQWVDLSDITDEVDGGGTADFAILHAPKRFVGAVDLKYGVGERVWASYTDAAGKRKPNHQLGLYAKGLLKDAALLDIEVDKVLLCIVQPRLDHIDEQEFTVAEILALAEEARVAALKVREALLVPRAKLGDYLNPGDKTCRWCTKKAECPKLARFVQDTVAKDFEEIDVVNEPTVPKDIESLASAGRALPLIEQWCHAVRTAIHNEVNSGTKVIGADGKPLKFVLGDEGKRSWTNEAEAEGLLIGNPLIGPDKAYQPRKIITAPQAAKILDKKKTAAAWEPFKSLIKRAPGRPVLALGSDPRPAYTGAAAAHEFTDETEIGVE